MLTVTGIGHCLFNDFSSLFIELHHLSHRVVFAISCHFSDDEDIFCVVLYAHLRQALKLVGWEKGNKAGWGLSDGFFFFFFFFYGWFPGQGRRKCKQEFAQLEPLTLCWGNLSCLNLCVHSHLVCQHLNWSLLLKLAQRITSSLVFIICHCSASYTDTLGSDLKEITRYSVSFCSCPKGKLKSWSIGTTDLQCSP